MFCVRNPQWVDEGDDALVRLELVHVEVHRLEPDGQEAAGRVVHDCRAFGVIGAFLLGHLQAFRLVPSPIDSAAESAIVGQEFLCCLVRDPVGRVGWAVVKLRFQIPDEVDVVPGIHGLYE